MAVGTLVLTRSASNGADGPSRNSRAKRAIAEVEDFVARRRPSAGDGVQLVVAVEIVLVRVIADGLALWQFLGDAWIVRRRSYALGLLLS